MECRKRFGLFSIILRICKWEFWTIFSNLHYCKLLKKTPNINFRLKGLLLFGTLILIGTGYTFIKQFLTDRDRKVFMFVLPIQVKHHIVNNQICFCFQVIDNIILIILNESEIGTQNHETWLKLFVILDLFCCALVAFPIVW